MATRAAAILIRATRSGAVELSDCELLNRYVEMDDQAAFATVIGRHSAMVLGVCRRLLPSSADAEDACQAVFLLLARKAKSTRWQPSVANWLYATARKVAQNARLASARRRRREGVAAVPESVAPVDRMSGRELTATLDEELDKLPPRYREPLVLCYLEGLTRDEAATRLGVPVATLKKQLERGRKKLADALTARGCILGISLLATFATSPSLASSPRLLESILAAVDGAPSTSVAALAKGVVVNGLLIRTKMVLVAVLGVAALGLGVGTVPSSAEPQKPAMEKPAAKAEGKLEKPKLDAKERTISGQVLGADGKPVVAELSFVWIHDKPQPLGKTKDDGTFTITVPLKRNDSGGFLLAKATGHGMDFVSHGLDYLPRSITASAEVTLKLPKERPIRGRLLDQQGKPVVGATVVASGFTAYDSATSADAYLKKWVGEQYQRGSPPDGDRSLFFSDGYSTKANPMGHSPYSAITDKEGRYVIDGIGDGQLVTLRIRGNGVADKEVITLNRDGFDAAPTNKAAKNNETKGYSFGGKWVLYGADPVVILESEKIIRGTVTDHVGQPRAGVIVVFSRPNKRDLNPDYNQAVTNKDGKYEIRGARKHKGYMVECSPDPVAGLLQCQAFADDTVGYEPVTLDLKCAKGVVIAGTVKNKATGKPIAAQLYVELMAENMFVDKYPPFRHTSSIANEQNQTDKDGKFRVVTIPGPVILMAGPLKGDGGQYKPAVADPKHPDRFTSNYGGSASLGLTFYAYDGGVGMVQGNWCRVVEAKATETELTVDVEFESAPKMTVKVIDADGKPVTDTLATGVTHCDFAYPTEHPHTDGLTVFNVEPKHERLLAVANAKRKLVGTATVKADDKNPTVKLGTGGSVTGRALDKEGKPLVGLSVQLAFTRREVTEAFNALKKLDLPTTDANGEFQIDTLFPNQEFILHFMKGSKRFGPDFDKMPKYTIKSHGDTLKLGDLKLEAAKDGD